MNEYYRLSFAVRRVITFLKDITIDFVWQRDLFVLRIKGIFSRRLYKLVNVNRASILDYYIMIKYNTKRNNLIKKKQYGKLIFYMRRGDYNMVKEVFLDKDYFRLKEFYPRKGNVIIDLGAGIGDYAILSSKLVGPRGLIVSVECDKNTYSLLKKNIEKNKLSNIITLNIAISNKKGKRIDDIVEKYKLNKVDLIKMDIEGFEYLALLGARNTLKRFHPKIVAEIHSTELRNKIRRYLERFGYKLAYEAKKFGSDFYLDYFV